VVQGVFLVDVVADRLAAREHPLEARDDPLVGDLLPAAMRLLGSLLPALFVLMTRAEEDGGLRLLGERRPGDARVDAQRVHRAMRLGGEGEGAAPPPREDGALAQRAPRIHDALRVHARARADAVAGGAGAVRAVEREHARLDRRERDAAV